jgi:hypothetical protein
VIPSAPAGPVILKTPKGSYSQTSSSDDWPTPAPAEPCVPAWATGACGCRTWAYEAGCHRLSCSACEDGLRIRRTQAIKARFEGPNGRGKKPVIYTIFTVPPELRAAAADPKTWTKWRRAIWKAMKKKFGGLFAVERTDPCGDRNPSLWHPHLNFLWVQRDGFSPYLDRDALAAEWAAVIGSEREIDFHTKYSDFWPRLQHWYSYMGRTFPDWQGSVRRHLGVRWLGKYPKKVPPEKSCVECGEDFVFVTGLDRKGAEELAALGPFAVRLEWEKREIARCLHASDARGLKSDQP